MVTCDLMQWLNTCMNSQHYDIMIVADRYHEHAQLKK